MLRTCVLSASCEISNKDTFFHPRIPAASCFAGSVDLAVSTIVSRGAEERASLTSSSSELRDPQVWSITTFYPAVDNYNQGSLQGSKSKFLSLNFWRSLRHHIELFKGPGFESSYQKHPNHTINAIRCPGTSTPSATHI